MKRCSPGKTSYVNSKSYSLTGSKRRGSSKLGGATAALQSIVDSIPDAVLAIDREGKVLVWNRAIEKMTSVKKEDILGKGEYNRGGDSGRVSCSDGREEARNFGRVLRFLTFMCSKPPNGAA